MYMRTASETALRQQTKKKKEKQITKYPVFVFNLYMTTFKKKFRIQMNVIAN